MTNARNAVRPWTPESFEAGCELVSKAFWDVDDASLSYALSKWSLMVSRDGEAYLEHDDLVAPTPPTTSTASRGSGAAIFRPVDDDAVPGTDSERGSDEDLFVDYTLTTDHDLVAARWEVGGCRDDRNHYSWRFSIVYSHTWRVPVLYFTVQDRNSGATCPRTEVVEMLEKVHHQNQLVGQPPGDAASATWDFCSQEEHPITGLPAFFLHPCRTQERLTTMTRRQHDDDDDDDDDDETADVVSYGMQMLTWMSLILPSVGFAIPCRLFLQLQKEINLVG